MTQLPVSARLAALRVRHMTLLDLIASGGSLSRVAELLCVSQPAVTAMLKELESVFGARLVERNRQGARLTPLGAATHQRMKQALNVLGALESSLRMRPAVWHLRVGVLNSAMLSLVADAVARVREAGPQISFQFIESPPESCMEGLVDGRLDCALGRVGVRILQAGRPRALRITHLHRVPLKVVAATGHPLLRGRGLGLADLLGHDWVLLPHETESRQVFDHAFSQGGLVPPPPAVESKSLLANFRLVAQTRMLSIAPETALRDLAPKGVRALPFEWPIGLSPFVFVCLEDLADLQPVTTFRSALNHTSPH